MAAPPGGLAILVDEKRVNELLQQKSGLKALLRSTFNTVLFVVFLILFTSLALSEPRDKMRAFEGYLRKKFDEEAAISLSDVHSVESFWKYHNESFMPAIYGQDRAKYSFPGAVVATWLQVDGPNYLYGMGRFRGLNVKADADCMVAQQFQSYFPTCYGPFSLAAMDTEAYGPGNDEGVPSFSYINDPTGEPYSGMLAVYPPGGYTEIFTPDYLTTNEKFYIMQTEGFLSEKTRAIFLEFTIYNFNLGLYGVCRIVFEVAAAGDWSSSFEIDVLVQRHLQPLGAGTTEDWLFLILEAALLLFVLRYVLEEASEFVGFESRSGGKKRITIKWDYFLDAWNILDWFNLIMMIVTVCYKVDTWAKAGGLYVISPSDWKLITRNMYSNFHPVASNIRQVHSLVAFNTILTWFKAVKYINIIPYVTTFMQTVSIAQVNLGSWIVVFCCTLTGFVLAFSTAFGADISSLQTPFQAFIFIMLTILGNSDVSVIYTVSPLLGSLLIIIYVVGIFFVIMNLFYAIIVSTLSDAKIEDAKQKKKWAVMRDRLEDTWKALNRGGKLEKQFRGCFPGLYSRIMRRKKRIELHEKARDDMVLRKEMKLRSEDLSLALGPGSSSWGRRPKRQVATVAMGDGGVESESEASEPDLGPLRSSDQLRKEEKTNVFAAPQLMIGDQQVEEEALEDDAVDLVIDATRHVGFGVVERTKGAKSVLFAEMSESMDVLNNVATVLELLGKRTRDLEAQQRQILRH